MLARVVAPGSLSLRGTGTWTKFRDPARAVISRRAISVCYCGPSEIGAHPTQQIHEGVTYDSPRHHSISSMCDDLERTIVGLESKGAEFAGPVEKQSFGITVPMKVPGADDITLYEPGHPTAYDL